MIRSASALSLYLLALLGTAAAAVNEWPVVGVFTHPSSDAYPECGGSCNYLAASYVKYLESAGARVVPIPYDASNADADRIFEGVNALFFPGGGAMPSNTAKYMYQRAVEANDAGDYFPIWGTCLGFQWLLMLTSHNDNILDGDFDSDNYTIPLNFTSELRNSRMFEGQEDIVDILATQPVTFNAHHAGIETTKFFKTESLSSFYRVTSTNVDRKGREFVSTMEAYKYPFFGAQWHPEKNNFEWGKVDGQPNEVINHSPDGIKVAQWAANFFVSEARKNFHKFEDAEEEDKLLIWNHQPTKTGPKFVQTYYFHW